MLPETTATLTDIANTAMQHAEVHVQYAEHNTALAELPPGCIKLDPTDACIAWAEINYEQAAALQQLARTIFRLLHAEQDARNKVHHPNRQYPQPDQPRENN